MVLAVMSSTILYAASNQVQPGKQSCMSAYFDVHVQITGMVNLCAKTTPRRLDAMQTMSGQKAQGSVCACPLLAFHSCLISDPQHG